MRLLPVQLIESLSVFCIVAVGSGLVWAGRQPGEALAWYLVAYALLRFALEFVRGDGVRPYLLGFSEAQWTSLAVTSTTMAAGLVHVVPFRWWQAAAAAALPVAMAALAVGRRLRATNAYRLLQARHVDELAQALEELAGRTQAGAGEVEPGRALPVPVLRTSLGLLISSGRVADEGSSLCHYALSQEGAPLGEETGSRLARLLAQLGNHSASPCLLKGGNGVLHVVMKGEGGGSAGA